MYLKRVELSGFKSFADRTEFEFVPGITAVIGPNGSGKSNITDAIRWVLGEQSAKTLRGAKMEDVIFAGSDSRKPVNYSEVSLTLDNQDRSLDMEYSEVTVTRRLYRSGESEYYINNQPCRLKDITELFMDTGLGKEAYSIIGQGRIEEILSSKSEDRRGIFEEAAGIVKYKTRKKEAQKKLDETEQNLVRINDLIYELKDQIEPLEEQAKVAKQYKDYANQLKELNIQWYVHDIEKAHLEWQNTENAKKN
ncbi:chromosome segregation SMC family protein [Tepidibacillus decaturensis]